MTSRAAFRGQPLLLLAAVLGGWIGVRAVAWTPPFAEWAEAGLAVPVVPTGLAGTTGRAVPATASTAPPASVARRRLSAPRLFAGAEQALAVAPFATTPVMEFAEPVAEVLAARRLIAPLPIPLATGPIPAGRPSRWSGDAWVLWRPDGSAPLLAAQPGYGRSQAGAVLRYDLAPGSGHAPQAYVRASTALAGPRERELAGGLFARPMPEAPVRVAAEVRVSERAAGTVVRPAAYAVTELPPQPLPLGLRGELYAQAGYVGGEDATAFVDGQARIERGVVRASETELTIGAGAWGGAQQGAERLDAGPTAALGFPLGSGRGRIAIDYRFRVAGDAEPGSGAALTLSAGF